MTDSITIINDEKVYHDAFTNGFNNTRRAVKSGCEVTESSPQAMSVDIASGEVYFDSSVVAISATTVSIDAADPSEDRMDLVVVDISGTISVINGNSRQSVDDPRPPAFDIDDYVVLARVYVDDGATVITNTDIKDLRVLFTIVSGSGSGQFNKTFSNSSQITVNHQLASDDLLVQVYNESNEQILPNKIDLIDTNNVYVELGTLSSGKIIIVGGESTTSGAGGVGTYVHTQGTLSSSWIVTHNLNDLNPVVEVYNTSSNIIEPEGIEIDDNNSLTLTFGSDLLGKVRVLAGRFSGGVGDGNYLPTLDNTYDIGGGVKRWKDGYFAGNVNVETLNNQSPAGFKYNTGTFNSTSSTTVTIVDSFCTDESLVTISIYDTTSPQGVWSVESNNGSFDITSDTLETEFIDFDYYITRVI